LCRGAYPVGVIELDSKRGQQCSSYPIQRVHNTPGNAVLSLGNPLRGDDGIGSRIIERLKTHPLLPENVTLMNATTLRPEYLLGMKAYRRIMIVDAAEIGRQAGEWIRIELKTRNISSSLIKNFFSSHDLNLTDVIVMGCILDLWPPSTELYAVQPAQFDWGANLSERVRKAVPHICDEIVRRLSSPSHRVVPGKPE